MRDFFEMGGYAEFLWPAYGITVAALIINVMSARRALARARREAARRCQLEDTEGDRSGAA